MEDDDDFNEDEKNDIQNMSENTHSIEGKLSSIYRAKILVRKTKYMNDPRQ